MGYGCRGSATAGSLAMAVYGTVPRCWHSTWSRSLRESRTLRDACACILACDSVKRKATPFVAKRFDLVVTVRELL